MILKEAAAIGEASTRSTRYEPSQELRPKNGIRRKPG